MQVEFVYLGHSLLPFGSPFEHWRAHIPTCGMQAQLDGIGERWRVRLTGLSRIYRCDGLLSAQLKAIELLEAYSVPAYSRPG